MVNTARLLLKEVQTINLIYLKKLFKNNDRLVEY